MALLTRAEMKSLLEKIKTIPFECGAGSYVVSVPELVDVTILHGMTVIAGYINRPGEAMIATDSCTSNEAGNQALRHNAAKSIRINAEWSLALSNHSWAQGFLAAMLHGDSVVCDDPFGEIERRGLVRNDLLGDRAVSFFSDLFSEPGRDFARLCKECQVLLVGGRGDLQGIYHWPSQKAKWKGPDRYEITDSNNRLVIIAPGGKLRQIVLGASIEEVMGALLEHYTRYYPQLVDTNLVIRRLSNGFARDV